jgi:hypothetical protein
VAKTPAPLPNRLARLAERLGHGAVLAVLRPRDERRGLPEVCWDALCGWRGVTLRVSGPGELAGILARRPALDTSAVSGWISAVLTRDLAYPGVADDTALASATAVEHEVLTLLGPAARWHTNSTPPPNPTREWDPVTTSPFDLLLTARGPTHDLVLTRAQDD